MYTVNKIHIFCKAKRCNSLLLDSKIRKKVRELLNFFKIIAKILIESFSFLLKASQYKENIGKPNIRKGRHYSLLIFHNHTQYTHQRKHHS